MKKTDIEELRQQSVEELNTKITEARKELLDQRFSQAIEGVQRNASYRNARRDIARMQTIIAEKKQAEKKQSEVNA